jgi:hypothetical protein
MLAALGTLLIVIGLVRPSPALACGGFFCTTIPVDQAAERIIFAVDEGRITTFVQINYVGSPDEFAWVLPVPAPPKLDTADMATFRDLDRMTTPVFIPPPSPDCLRRQVPMAAPAAAGREGVQVLDSGVVGPFGYHVVTSPDPGEMVRWLRDNGYRIEPAMEPLIKVYTDEGLVFLAMKLQPGKDSRDITPIRLEYPGRQPMIPLRLTAVAAEPNMGVLVWLFGAGRTEPLNYVEMTVSDGEVGFNPFGANNYRQIVGQAADQAGGRAFVAEFAGPTSLLRPTDPTVQLLVQQYPYLTRFYTRLSPEEMTVDPVFDFAPLKGNVNNVHDLSGLPSPFDCSDDLSTFKTVPGAGLPPSIAAGLRKLEQFGSSGAPRAMLLASALSGVAFVAVRRGWRPTASRLTGRGAASGWAISAQAGRLLLLEALIIQGLHEVEHIVQVVQRTWLGIHNGAGVFGSVFDQEPVHLVYNLAFLALLGLAYLGCRRAGAIPRRSSLVIGLLTLALLAQSYHFVEHTVKMAQFLESGRNGTPGILGNWLPIVWLHFGFNTLIYLPVVAAFLLGGFPGRLGRDLGPLLRKSRLRRPARA